MADLQRQFEAFETTIRIDRKLEKAILVEKRERILRRLKEGLAKKRASGTNIPGYRHRNQGSYAMDTGIKPLDDDYDLDVAIIFDLPGTERPSPTVVKGWVHDAVKNHTDTVRWREPCVTVFYKNVGETVYHVDLAIYAQDDVGRTYLARGRENAPPEARGWEAADPEALIDIVRTRFDEVDHQAQFRRCIRYLKRWKDLNFSSQGNEAPRGIALTACTYQWFTPRFNRHLDYTGQRPDDSAALMQVIDAVLGRFDWRGRVQVSLPVAPGNDLFDKMSDRQLENFRAKLEQLGTALADARADPDPYTAAKTLVKVFGPDFPVPSKPSTATKRGPGYVSSGNSG